jgi:hypothetical protein
MIDFDDLHVGERIMWRWPNYFKNQEGGKEMPLHTGTVMSMATGGWLQVQEDTHFFDIYFCAPKWLSMDQLNLCEKIIE